MPRGAADCGAESKVIMVRKHPSWSEFVSSMGVPEPAAFAVIGEPSIELISEPDPPRLVLRIRTEHVAPAGQPALAAVTTRSVVVVGDRWLELAVGDQTLFPF